MFIFILKMLQISIILFMFLTKYMLIHCTDIKYNAKRNVLIDLNFNEFFLLDTLSVKREFTCLAECTKIDTCVSCAFDQETTNGLNCYLYNRHIAACTMASSASCSTIMSLFTKLCKFRNTLLLMKYYII